jgi:AcrR family transcriptional regulator
MSCKPACAICERLRTAALEIVGEAGTEGVTVDSLAERTGVAAPDVVRHYATAADCIYETYDRVECDVLMEMVAAFDEGSDWQSGFEISRRRLFERMATNPAEARLCFVETARGDRELRRRRVDAQRWIVRFLTREHRRWQQHESVPAIQLEMLIGAGFQTISGTVADGDAAELSDLEPKLAAVDGYLLPERV